MWIPYNKYADYYLEKPKRFSRPPKPTPPEQDFIIPDSDSGPTNQRLFAISGTEIGEKTISVLLEREKANTNTGNLFKCYDFR